MNNREIEAAVIIEDYVIDFEKLKRDVIKLLTRIIFPIFVFYMRRKWSVMGKFQR